MHIKDLYNQQGPTYYKTSPNCQSRKICYSNVRYQQQDICDVHGYPKAKRNTGTFQKSGLS